MSHPKPLKHPLFGASAERLFCFWFLGQLQRTRKVGWLLKSFSRVGSWRVAKTHCSLGWMISRNSAGRANFRGLRRRTLGHGIAHLVPGAFAQLLAETPLG